MDDIDNLLSIVENPTRRRILEALVREPHYPLQLSKELGVSQQAVMKNLALMEQCGMVVRYHESSNMGPRRTLYSPNVGFTLLIDMRNHTFTTKLITSERSGEDRAKVVDAEEAMRRIRELDSEISGLDRERARLVDERNSLMNWFMGMIQETGDYEERKRMYGMLNETLGNRS
ncbi:MAG: helix-turn-helix domain-containing protein [Candidatus Methanomethylophilaceae archaeon]|nr:helix-turn-helix domain-containing protein [Candidatus Methanomethylophilaceae archaeon]